MLWPRRLLSRRPHLKLPRLRLTPRHQLQRLQLRLLLLLLLLLHPPQQRHLRPQRLSLTRATPPG